MPLVIHNSRYLYKIGIRQSAAGSGKTMLNEYIGKNVVVDLSGQFVCVGVLQRIDPDYLELNDADFHDLRDSKTGRENYVVDSRLTGVKRNRKCVLLVRRECVAVSLLEDIVVE